MCPRLPRLWLLAILFVSLAIWWLAGCGWKLMVPPANLQVKKSPVAEPPKTPEQGKNESSPAYTYVGQATPPNDAPADAGDEVAPVSEPPPIIRETQVDSATGKIPDLHIRLAGNDIRRVMTRYGYVAAVKTRTRLLGAIMGDAFVPMTEAQLSRYAKRGRAGDAFPNAERWKADIARELDIPLADLQCIFLVPHRTEQFFIRLQQQALQRTGRSGQEIVLVRAHFAPDLSLVVDELVTASGETVAVDSIRGSFDRLPSH